MNTLDDARAALRDRLGAGARWDAAEAPSEVLAWVRLGTAYFARLLNDLSDAELDAPSLALGWSRRHVVAQVGYQARALTRLTQWAASGVPQAMYASEAARLVDIENGATLPARALRGLFRHAAVHLDVEWRDLDAAAWDAGLFLPDGSPCMARDTPWIRAREIWLRAVDLDSGGSFLDVPAPVLDRLVDEAAAAWSGSSLSLVASDRASPWALGAQGGHSVHGRAADLARWITGRGARRLSHEHPLPAIATADRRID